MSKTTPAAIGGRFPGAHLVGGAVLLGLSLVAAAGCGSITAQGKNAEGVRLFDQARYQEALYQFQTAANRNSENADAYYNLGATYHRLGTINQDSSYLKQAEHYYNQCLDRDESHRECHRGLAVLLMETDRRQEALRLLRGWVERQPMSAEPRIELARLSEEFGDRTVAKEQLLEAIAVDPQNPCALAALGRIREQDGEYAQALANYRQSLWRDRFQGEVAARVAALQSAVKPTGPITSPAGGTRMAHAGSGSLR